MRPRYLFVIVAVMALPALSVGPIRKGEATYVEIDGRNVTITVPIDAVGIDDATKQTWKTGAEDVWNAAFNGSDNPYKNCIHLKLIVDINPVKMPDKGLPKVNPKRHMIYEWKNAPPLEAPGGIICAGRDPWQAACDGHLDPSFDDPRNKSHVAHEVGHLLGFHDDYAVVATQPERVTTPLPCRLHTLMADGGPPDCDLIKRLVERIHDLADNIPDDCPHNLQCKCLKPECPEPQKAGEIDFLAPAFDKLAWGTYTGAITSHEQWTVRSGSSSATATATEDWTIGLKFWSECLPGGCRKTPYMYPRTPTRALHFGPRAQGTYTATRRQPRTIDGGTSHEYFIVDQGTLSDLMTDVLGSLQPKDSGYEYQVAGYFRGNPLMVREQGGHFIPFGVNIQHNPAGVDGEAACASALVGSMSFSMQSIHWQFVYTPLKPEDWPKWESLLPKQFDGRTPRNLQTQVRNAANQAWADLLSKGQKVQANKLDQYRKGMKLLHPDFDDAWELGGKRRQMLSLAEEANTAWGDSTDDKTYQTLISELQAAVDSYRQYKRSLEREYADEIDQLAAQIQGPQAQTLHGLAQKLRTEGIEGFYTDSF